MIADMVKPSADNRSVDLFLILPTWNPVYKPLWFRILLNHMLIDFRSACDHCPESGFMTERQALKCHIRS